CERSSPLVQARLCYCPANRRNTERPPIVETCVCKLFALTAGRRFMRHRLAMSQKPTTCGLDRCELALLHSITSSARASSVGGTVRPSALAVFRLITSSYLVGA